MSLDVLGSVGLRCAIWSIIASAFRAFRIFEVTADGQTVQIGARDSAALAAGRPYGFVVGEDGIEFMVVRPGDAGSAYGS